MKHVTMVRSLRLLMLACSVALALQGNAMSVPGMPEIYAQPTGKCVVISSDVLKGAILIADGSESTGGGKPTKPNHG